MRSFSRQAERYVAGSLAAVAGAMALSGCAKSGEQSSKTQQTVRAIIQPLMQKVAKRTIQLAETDPAECTTSNNTAKGLVTIECHDELVAKDYGDIKIVTKMPGKKALSEAEPIYEAITTFSVSGDSNSVADSGTDELIAPGGGRFAINPAHPNDGWVAYDSGAVTIKGYNNNHGGAIFDTTDSSFYSANAYGEPSNPGATAWTIAGYIEGQYGSLQSAVDAIQSNSNPKY
ncbi:MAG: hypothetical protein ACHQT9_02470 [Candidatus Saccharimonadales bacterium]